MDLKKRNQLLHDIKRIAQAAAIMQAELDRLYEDLENGERDGFKDSGRIRINKE